MARAGDTVVEPADPTGSRLPSCHSECQDPAGSRQDEVYLVLAMVWLTWLIIQTNGFGVPTNPSFPADLFGLIPPFLLVVCPCEGITRL